MDVNRIKEILSLDRILSHSWCLIGCSAKTGENIMEAIKWIVQDIASRLYLLS